MTKTDQDEPSDVFGRLIRTGDFILYPTTYGRSAVLSFCEVVDVVPWKPSWPGQVRQSYHNPTIVAKTVRGIHDGVSARTKESRLLFPCRGFVVPRSSLPAACLELLKTVPSPKGRKSVDPA